MINKNYFSNIPSKNVLNEDTKNLSEKYLLDSNNPSLDNMILNSNLDNENIIK